MTGSQGFKINNEGESLSRRAKKTVRWRPGVRRQAKRRFWKTTRQDARREVEMLD